jgi:ribonuclease Z
MINGFRAAYRADMEERHRVLGAENLDPKLVFNGARDVLVTGESADLVYSSGDLSIRAFRVDHPDWPHAYGYRIEYKGKVVVISGDTRASDGIRRHAKGADILIHEALNSEIFNYIGEQMESRGGPMAKGRVALITRVHTPTLELANIAHEAGVRNLIITHLIPALPALWIADKFFIDGMEEIYAGNIIVARDGQWIEVSKL